MQAALYCIFCGHELHAVEVPSATERPSLSQLRTAYDVDSSPERPWWVDGAPRCPRCRSQLFLRLARRPLPVGLAA